MSKFAALIVEDTTDIQRSYKRAVERQGGEACVVSSLIEAVEAIKRRLFSVALIDVRLSEDDETNVDGLKVLEFIRKIGDPTNAILITGYGSFNIAREAFHQHDVFEGLEKGVALDVIESAIQRAQQQFSERMRNQKISYSSLLKGKSAQWEWEDRALRATSPTGGMDGLSRFLEGLLRDFTPLLSHKDDESCIVYDQLKIACGRFWSRGRGAAVLVAFGNKNEVRALESDPRPESRVQSLLNTPLELGSVLKKLESHALYGIVRELANQDYSQYAKIDGPK